MKTLFHTVQYKILVDSVYHNRKKSIYVQNVEVNLRMTMANTDSNDSGKHVQVTSAILIKQPLHSALL